MVDAAGEITGDLFAAGGNVFLGSAVAADVLTAGGNVTILSDVQDDVRAVGGTVTVGGAVSGDVAAVAGQTSLTGEGIAGDVLWAGGALTVNAPVDGTLRLAGGEVYINAPVAGDVHFRGEQLTLGSGARIEGDLSYRAPQEATIQEGAAVNGEITYEERPSVQPGRADLAAGLAVFASVAFLMGILMRLTGALVLGLGARPFALDLARVVRERPWASLGKGFVALVITPVLGALLLATIVGVPLGILTFVGYAVALIAAALLSPVLLGSLLHAWRRGGEERVSWATILLGVLIFILLTLIPIIGWIIELILLLMVLGGLCTIKWREMERYWNEHR
jgi:cytoskeletal protein CcmA (bactofilin family)